MNALHLGPGDDVELQLVVHQAGPGLREVPLVEDQTVPAEAAGAAQLLEPLGPLGVELSVRLLVLRFEHTDDLLRTPASEAER